MPACTPTRSWRLNERHYGALQGRARHVVRAELGDESYRDVRRSYGAVPPSLDDGDPTHPRRDARYAAVPAEDLPAAESLADIHHRLRPYWHGTIRADLAAGRTTLVVAHGNSLRALCMILDGLSPEQGRPLELPTGVPLRYDLDEAFVPRLPGGRYLRTTAELTA